MNVRDLICRLFCSILAFLYFGLATQWASADESAWPSFLGPSGDAIATNAKPLTNWDKSNYLWQVDIPGSGWSSPVFADNQVWLTTAVTKRASAQEIEKKRQGVQFANMKTTVSELKLYAVSVDIETGQIVHNIELATVNDPGLINPLNSYASPTPSISDGKVVCHFGNYGTWCLDSKSGQPIWETRYDVDHSVGAGSSPIIYDGKVIIVCDGIDDQFVAAVDLKSGKEIWKTKRPQYRSNNPEFQKAYSTPLIIEIDGKTQAVVPGAQWIVSYDPTNGKELWRADHGDGFSTTPMATFEKGLVVFATGFMKSEFVAIDPSGQGDVTKSHIKWRANQAPSMPSMISFDGKLFAISDEGIMNCLDVVTGKLLKRKRIGGNFSASPLLADGKIYLFSREGKVTIVNADETLSEVGNQKFEATLMATPAPFGNDLIIRTGKKLYRVGKTQG